MRTDQITTLVRAADPIDAAELDAWFARADLESMLATPLATRPHQPARCRAAACEIGSMRSWSIFCRGE